MHLFQGRSRYPSFDQSQKLKALIQRLFFSKILFLFCISILPFSLLFAAAPLDFPQGETGDHPFYTGEIPADIRSVDVLLEASDRLKGKKRAKSDLGIRWGGLDRGGVAIQKIVRSGPAEKAGLLPGDILLSIGSIRTQEQDDVDRAMALLLVNRPVRLLLQRPAVKRDARIEYAKGEKIGQAGFTFRKTKGRFLVTSVRRGSPAFRSGLKVGDTFLHFDQTRIKSSGHAQRLLSKSSSLTVKVERPAQRLTPTLKPVEEKEETILDWRGKAFQLAVILVEFADVMHNPDFSCKDFESMFFSLGEYFQAPGGRKTYGSVRDYYREVSANQFDIEGKVFDWVRVPGKWAYYDEQPMGSGDDSRRTIFRDALDGVHKKYGSRVLDPYQGLVFIYAGPRRSLRGSQLWPHRSSVRSGGKWIAYHIAAEGGEKFESIGVHCHEFGHMLGLPDFYGLGHRTGIGKFCTMSIGHLGGGESGADRPFHLCSYCKMLLGWLKPKILHPEDRQHIALRPVIGRTNEALKILISPSGDEYFLMEVRSRQGFDSDFFRDGLLIWHVGEDGQPAKGQISTAIDLEEAHGKRYFDASLREESRILFPNDRLDAFTHDTFPSSASNLPSACGVEICNIRVFQPGVQTSESGYPPGTIFFVVGDKRMAAEVRNGKPLEPEQPVYPEGEAVLETDPVTGQPVSFTIGRDNVAQPGPNISPRMEQEEEEKKKEKRVGTSSRD